MYFSFSCRPDVEIHTSMDVRFALEYAWTVKTPVFLFLDVIAFCLRETSLRSPIEIFFLANCCARFSWSTLLLR